MYDAPQLRNPHLSSRNACQKTVTDRAMTGGRSCHPVRTSPLSKAVRTRAVLKHAVGCWLGEAYFCVRLDDSEMAGRRVRIERLPTFNGLSKPSCHVEDCRLMLPFGIAFPYAALLVLKCRWLPQIARNSSGNSPSQAHPKFKRTVPAVVCQFESWEP